MPSAVLVHGEAGVGKTRLVTDVCDEYRAEGFQVLWGRCVRFGAAASSYQPFSQALGSLFSRADEGIRSRVFGGVGELALILPALGGAGAAHDAGRLPALIAAVIDRLTKEAPTVLAVDDLQWADTSSLDVLAYLITGFAEQQRLALLATYRDTDLPDGHPLHAWVADMRRMPSVSLLRLDRLDGSDTELLIDELIGVDHPAGVADEILARSGGNPYLTELLVTQGSSPRGVAGTTGVASGLRNALLANWHRLTVPTRELMQLLAVGGMPVSVAVLERLAEARGLGADKVLTGVAEASGQGVAAMDDSGDVWFRHPLVAEVLSNTLAPGEMVAIHREYVDVWEAAAEIPAGIRAPIWPCTTRVPATSTRHSPGPFAPPTRLRRSAASLSKVITSNGHVACGLGFPRTFSPRRRTRCRCS